MQPVFLRVCWFAMRGRLSRQSVSLWANAALSVDDNLIIFIHTTMCRDRQTDRTEKKNNTINTAVKIQKHEKRPRLMH